MDKLAILEYFMKVNEYGLYETPESLARAYAYNVGIPPDELWVMEANYKDAVRAVRIGCPSEEQTFIYRAPELAIMCAEQGITPAELLEHIEANDFIYKEVTYTDEPGISTANEGQMFVILNGVESYEVGDQLWVTTTSKWSATDGIIHFKLDYPVEKGIEIRVEIIEIVGGSVRIETI